MFALAAPLRLAPGFVYFPFSALRVKGGHQRFRATVNDLLDSLRQGLHALPGGSIPMIGMDATLGYSSRAGWRCVTVSGGEYVPIYFQSSVFSQANDCFV